MHQDSITRSQQNKQGSSKGHASGIRSAAGGALVLLGNGRRRFFASGASPLPASAAAAFCAVRSARRSPSRPLTCRASLA